MVQKCQHSKGQVDAGAGAIVETLGEAFSDGTLLELVSGASLGGKLRLLLWDGNCAKVQDSVNLNGRTYVPCSAGASLLQAIHFPNQSAEYSSMRVLFDGLVDLLKRYSSLPDRDLSLIAYWALSSWFSDVLPMCPTLLISSPSPACVSRFFRILKCICRRGVRLAELSLAGLYALPMKLRPTLLVDQTQLTRSMCSLLRASNNRGVYVARSGNFLDLHCPKALFLAGKALDVALTENALHVAVVPAESALPNLSERAADEISADFQPMLLGYRLRNYLAVSESTFDVPEFTPGLRDLACSLGAPIVGDAELASRIVPLLAVRDADARARRSVLPESAVLTTALALVHEGKLKQMLAKDFAQLANAALRANGEIIEYSAEEIGWCLSHLGLHTHRMAGGNGIRFNREFSRLVHNLARRFGVEMSPDSPTCPDCQEVKENTDSKNLM